jgi:RNA polymerase sigma-70 factor (ECF subfamily)
MYLAELLRYAYGVVRSREIAEDVVQDVLTWLWDNHQTLTVRESLRDYLFSAVRHRSLNYLRDARAGADREARYTCENGVGDLAVSHDDPVQEVERQELATVIQHAIDQLPERRRQILLLRWRQLSSSEIAGVLDISVKTVEAQITSAYATLRVTLSPWVK